MNAWKYKLMNTTTSEVKKFANATYRSTDRDNKFKNIEYSVLQINENNNKLDDGDDMVSSSRYSFSNPEDYTEVSSFFLLY